MRLVFAGTPQPALPSLHALVASAHEVVAVITRPDAPAGRGRRPVASPVRTRAEELGIPVLTPGSLKDPDFQSLLAGLAPDACPVVAYGSLIPPAALGIPVHGWINLHFSLLPAWRGAAPVQHALMAGDDVTGASTFLIEAGLDTGPVFGVMTERIRPDDTAADLLDRLATAGAQLLVATLDGIASGELRPRPQPAEGVSLAPKIEVADAHVDFTRPALTIDRHIRGCTPAPGRGRRSAEHDSSSDRSGWSRTSRGCPRGACASSGHRSSSARPRCRPVWGRCSRWASSRCRPRTGPAASGRRTMRFSAADRGLGPRHPAGGR